MEVSQSERRQIENEMIFRRRNEKVSNDLLAFDAMLTDEGNTYLVSDKNLILHFICECSDEDCQARIPLLVSDYQQIHTDRKAFIVKPDHAVASIEEVVKKTENYYVVKKKHSVPEPKGNLKETSVSNT